MTNNTHLQNKPRFRLTVAGKVVLLAGLLIAAALATGATGLWGQTRLSEASQTLERDSEDLRLAGLVERDLTALRGIEYRLVGEPELADELAARIDRLENAIRARFNALTADAKYRDNAALTQAQAGFADYVDALAVTLRNARRVEDMTSWGQRVMIIAGVKASAASAEKSQSGIASFSTDVAAERDAVAQAAVATGTAVHQWLLGAMAAVLLGGFLLAWLVAQRGIVRPLRRAMATLMRLTQDDRRIEIEETDRSDEIGDIYHAMRHFKDEADRRRRLEEDAQTRERETAAQRQREMHALADAFETKIGSIVTALSDAAGTLDGTARDLQTAAAEASQESSSVAAAAQQAAGNVQTVASAGEELSSSISEIGRQADQSRDIAQETARSAEDAGQRVHALAETVKAIGGIVDVIEDVAERTNLLALNATIEAARAGEAGKGFAVVAQEVKQLANQTAQATQDIGARIANVRAETDTAVTSIQDVTGRIGRISETITGIASAVEEQTAATNEIARNIQEAGHGTRSVSASITQVTHAADRTGQAAEEMTTASSTLRDRVDELRSAGGAFLGEVRAA